MPRLWWYAIILTALCLTRLVVVAQQAPSCEDRLLKANTRIDLMAAAREQNEDITADALAAARKQRDFWQAQAMAFKAQLDKKDKDAAEK